MRLKILAALIFALLVEAAHCQIVIPPRTISIPKSSIESFGDVYGRVRFDITQLNVDSQQYWLGGLIDKVFGIKDSGEYIIALELLDPGETGDDKLVARKVIAHFVRSPDGSLIGDVLGLFKGTELGGKKARDLSLIIFSGELASRVPVNQRTNGYSIALQVFKSKSLELTNGDMIQSVLDVINSTSGVLKFAPVNVAVKEVYAKMRTFGFELYKSFAENSVLVVSQTQMSFIAANQSAGGIRPNVIRFDFPFEFDKPATASICYEKGCFNNSVRVQVSFDTYASEISNLTDGKFRPPHNWSNWLSQGLLTGKNVVQHLAEADATKAFVVSLNNPVELSSYVQKKSMVSSCDDIVHQLRQYYSAADVAALYWAFLQEYWYSISSAPNGTACQEKYADIFFERYGLPLKPVLVTAGALKTDEERIVAKNDNNIPMPGIFPPNSYGVYPNRN